jgi:DNA-binding CsgD family transcriptional regulator
LLALVDGATGQARLALGAAVGGWQERGRVWERTWALLDLARAHLRSNQRADAARVAEAVGQIATQLGAPALEAAAAEIVATARRGQPVEPWAPLTAREFEVARLIAEGRTNGEIAGDLGVTRKTVASHVEHILAKLGVGRRTEVAAWTAGRPVLHSRPHGSDREE